MAHRRQVNIDLRKIKEVLEDTLIELEMLEIEGASISVKKAINIVDASLEREERRRRDE